MKTYAFIGSDKNAGKTTAFNFVLHHLPPTKRVCITSIGLNGEKWDNYELFAKPAIYLTPNIYFVTTPEHLQHAAGAYHILRVITPPRSQKTFVLAQSLFTFSAVLEGPNIKSDVPELKAVLQEEKMDYLFIDGSIDRQFLGDASISDAFYFCLLLSERKEQQAKCRSLLYPLSLTNCSSVHNSFITKHEQGNTKTLLWADHLLHHGTVMAFQDQDLRHAINAHMTKPLVLYMQTALTASLYRFLATLPQLTVILQHFALYQNTAHHVRFRGNIQLRNALPVKAIFIKEETSQFRPPLPDGVPTYNLFREGPHAIFSSAQLT